MPRYNAFGEQVSGPVLPGDFYAKSDAEVARARKEYEAAMDQWNDEAFDPITGASMTPCPYLEQFIKENA